MIAVPPGWTIEHLPEAVAFTHPSGGAHIHYRERAGRPRRVGMLAREILAGWPQLRVKSFGAIERMVTLEGELAAVLSVECSEGDRDVHIDLGFVFTDDFFTSIAGTCRDAALRGDIRVLVRELIREDNLALGIRRRRFEYQPPPGWQPFRRSLATEWLPPEYPAHDTRLIAYPANPIAVAGRLSMGNAHTYLERLDWDVTAVGPVETGATRAGLAFEAQDVSCRHPAQKPRKTRFLVLSDHLYQYPFELRIIASPDALADRKTLAAVAETVIPFGPISAAINFWFE